MNPKFALQTSLFAIIICVLFLFLSFDVIRQQLKRYLMLLCFIQGQLQLVKIVFSIALVARRIFGM